MLNFGQRAFCGWRAIRKNLLLCKTLVRKTEKNFCVTTECIKNENL